MASLIELQKELSKVREEIKALQQKVVEPERPSILTPGVTTETIKQYEADLKEYQKVDKQEVASKIVALQGQEVSLCEKCQEIKQEALRSQYEKDVESINSKFTEAMLSLQEFIVRYESTEEIQKYIDAYRSGSPLQIRHSFDSFAAQCPYVELRPSRMFLGQYKDRYGK